MTADLADVVRWVGVGLQVIGFVLAALGITSVRERLLPGRRGIVGTVAGTAVGAWRRITGKERYVELAGVSMGSSTAVGDLLGRKVIADQTDLPARVAEVERIVAEHDRDLDELRRRLADEINARNEAIVEERRARDAAISEIRSAVEQLADVSAGPSATLGVFLFTTGVILAGFPGGVAEGLRSLQGSFT